MKKTVGLLCVGLFACANAANAGGTLGQEAYNLHQVVSGDCLWNIAEKYCGKPEDWRKLYNANMRIIKKPELIYPGQQLAITCMADGGIKVEVVETGVKAAAAALPAAPAVTAEVPAVAVSSAMPIICGTGTEEERAPAPPAPAPKPDSDAALLAELKQLAAEAGPIKTDKLGVSPAMPADMTWGFPSQTALLVSKGWQADGKVVAADLEDALDTMAGPGDIVQLELRAANSVRAGDFVTVYRRGNEVQDSLGQTKIQLQRSAALKIRAVSGRVATAEVVRAMNPVEVDDAVMK